MAQFLDSDGLKTLVDNINKKYQQSTNIGNSTGANSLIQTRDPKYLVVDVKTKNPNAYALDNSLDNTDVQAKGDYSFAMGGNTAALGKRSMAQGTSTVAKGAYSHAEGDNSVTLGADSHAEGYATVAYGTAAHAEGSSTIAVGGNSHAEGAGSISEGAVSHAEGTKTRAKGINAHTEGWNTLVGPKPSTSQGSSTGAGSSGGSGSSGEGTEGDDFDPTVPNNAHAEGSSTVAYGYGAHAEGVNTWANQYSHAEGYGTHSEGEKSHAEGFLTHAQGIASHTEGQATVATAHFAHAEGQETQASGLASHAGGYKSQVTGNYSIVHGTGLKNYGSNSAVFGKYNKTNGEDTLFEIGNGTSDTARSNAFEVNKDGDAKVYGNLDVEGKELRCGGILVLTQNSDYLFRHAIGVVAGTIIGSFEFTSTSNIVCNTLGNLRIALRPGTSSGSTLRLFGSTMKYESCTLEVTTSSCKVYMYDRSTDKAISADVTVVTDAVFVA